MMKYKIKLALITLAMVVPLLVSLALYFSLKILRVTPISNMFGLVANALLDWRENKINEYAIAAIINSQVGQLPKEQQ
jgi:hypothetical protein